MNLVGNDLLDSGRYIREHGGIDLEPADIVEQACSTGSPRAWRRRCPGGRVPSSLLSEPPRTACGAHR